MFDAIALQNSTQPGRAIDPGFLAECLIFYRRVVIVGNTATVKDLIATVGGENLLELLRTRRLEIHYKEDQAGVHTQARRGRQYHSLVRVSSPQHTIGKVADLLQAEITQAAGNPTLADDLASCFTKATYIVFDSEAVYSSLADRRYVEKAVTEIIQATAPRYLLSTTLRFRVHREQDGLVVNTNIDFERLNREYHAQVPAMHSSLTPAWLLCLIQDAHISLSIAGSLNSELGEDPIITRIHGIQLDDLLSRSFRNREAIASLTDLVLDDARAIREAVNTGEVTFTDVLALLDRAERFKAWLQEQEPSSDLIKAYYRETVSESWAAKLPARASRWGLFTALGVGVDVAGAGGLGTAAAIGVSAADAFLLDRLLKGWKPHHFVENSLRRVIKKS